jgi:DNA-binding NarL/FixJ family response regulator
MPAMNGIEAAKEIARTFPEVKVVMLSSYSDSALIEVAFAAGASGYVVKVNAFSELIRAIKAVLGGQVYVYTER